MAMKKDKITSKDNHQKMVLAIVVSLTLGLSPFFPEPHLVGKIRWILGGAVGMQPIDYFDLLMHGAPWIYLIVLITKKLVK